MASEAPAPGSALPSVPRTLSARMIAATGGALLVLLVVEGVTILDRRGLLTAHIFVGMVLLGPVALKLGVTAQRVRRGRQGVPGYPRRTPDPLLRLIAAPLSVSTVAVLASGVVLLATGPSGRGAAVSVHKVAFLSWIALFAVHLIGHLGQMSTTVLADLPGAPSGRRAPGRAGRWGLVAGSLAVGLVVAGLTLPAASPWERPREPHDGHAAQLRTVAGEPGRPPR